MPRMIYKFKCKAAGDLIMLEPQGDALLRVLGREPVAQGIIEPTAMAAAIAAIEAAVAADELQRAQAEREASEAGARLPARQGVSPRARFWPMLEMLRRASAADQAIVWGV